MDPAIKQLLEQKLATIVRDLTAEFADQMRIAWEQVIVGQGGWLHPGGLFVDLQSASYRTVIERGKRVADMLSETLRTLNIPYAEDLSTELGSLLDPLFPEDLHLGAVLNAPDNLKRRGLPVSLDERSFDLSAAGARGAIANASRDARARTQLVIDEYLLSVKSQAQLPEKTTLTSKVLDSVSLKPGIFGFSVDLKKLFSRKSQSS
jgi:hypothetical protein